MRSKRHTKSKLRINIAIVETTSIFFLLIGNSDSISGLRC